MKAIFLLLVFALPSTTSKTFVPGHGASLNVSVGAPTFTYSWTEGQLGADEASLDLYILYTDTGSAQPYLSEYKLDACQPSGDGDGEIPQSFGAGDALLLHSTWYDATGNAIGTATSSVFL